MTPMLFLPSRQAGRDPPLSSKLGCRERGPHVHRLCSNHLHWHGAWEEDPGHNPHGCPIPAAALFLPNKANKFPVSSPFPSRSIMGRGNCSASPLVAVHGPEVGCRELSSGWRWTWVQNPFQLLRRGGSRSGQVICLPPHRGSPTLVSPPKEKIRGRSALFFFF